MPARIVIAFALLGMSAMPLLAKSNDNPGSSNAAPHFYLGANYGYYKTPDSKFSNEYDLLEGLIGVNFSRYFGIEASAINFGHIGAAQIEAEVDGWTGSAMLRLPLSNVMAIYARGGMLFWNAKLQRSDSLHETLDDSDMFYGAGIDFRITRMLRFAFEYVRYEIMFEASPVRVTTDIDAAKLGLRLDF
ncbi:MAG: porin family protein [Chromatiales bacterium]|jgi:hypothetical protein|nr:porin family protein [Chromatiales bacterium]